MECIVAPEELKFGISSEGKLGNQNPERCSYVDNVLWNVFLYQKNLEPEILELKKLDKTGKYQKVERQALM